MKKSIEKSLKATRFTHKDEVNKKWYLVDANGKILGRMATQIARIIRGKNNPQFTPNVDTGDFVVVINAEKVRLTGKREILKQYKHHSLYPGGQKIRSFQELIAKHPDKVIRNAVKGMLPKTKLGNRLITKLKVYAGDSHPHAAQNPITKQI
ncbi:MAG: 50S ribosomal protein L13 [Chlorobi bacterium]|nr:50S ribosomal protein L13 [Chlorobiota bacterium]MCI0716721.1 50S ribosomal protein L13 [Chlorobiota bacterium]